MGRRFVTLGSLDALSLAGTRWLGAFAPLDGAAPIVGWARLAWWTEAWALFMRNPLLWVALGVILLVGTIVVSMVPLLGGLAVSLLIDRVEERRALPGLRRDLHRRRDRRIDSFRAGLDRAGAGGPAERVCVVSGGV